MADVIAFIDGFDHYTVSQGGRKYETFGASSMVSPRVGSGQALNFATTNYIQKGFTNHQAWRIGIALKINSDAVSNNSLISLLDGSDSQVELQITSARNLRITRNGTVVGSAGSTTLALGNWYHIEWYVSIKDSLSSGNCQVKLNGVTELNITSGDIQNTANAYANQMRVSGAAFWSYDVDDLVVSLMDDTTTPTFLGDMKVETLYPNGNGNYSAFIGSDADSTNNYQLVDEAQISDSDYVEDDVTSDRDSYTMTNPATAPSSVAAVQISSSLRKEDAGARTAKLFTRIGGTDYDGSAITPTTSYQIYRSVLETNPDTSSAWTGSDLNSLEAGIKVES